MSIFSRLTINQCNYNSAEDRISASFICLFENLTIKNKLEFLDQCFNGQISREEFHNPEFEYELNNFNGWFGELIFELGFETKRPDFGIKVIDNATHQEKELFIIFENKLLGYKGEVIKQLNSIDSALNGRNGYTVHITDKKLENKEKELLHINNTYFFELLWSDVISYLNNINKNIIENTLIDDFIKFKKMGGRFMMTNFSTGFSEKLKEIEPLLSLENKLNDKRRKILKEIDNYLISVSNHLKQNLIEEKTFSRYAEQKMLIKSVGNSRRFEIDLGDSKLIFSFHLLDENIRGRIILSVSKEKHSNKISELADALQDVGRKYNEDNARFRFIERINIDNKHNLNNKFDDLINSRVKEIIFWIGKIDKILK